LNESQEYLTAKKDLKSVKVIHLSMVKNPNPDNCNRKMAYICMDFNKCFFSSGILYYLLGQPVYNHIQNYV